MIAQEQPLPAQVRSSDGIRVPFAATDLKALIGHADAQTGIRVHYWLEPDAAGCIVGGEWLSDAHPDYLWLATCPAFTGEFAELAQLYRTASGRDEGCRLRDLP